jgi:dipeptidyl aminopeptidase/acylaminoacyl peptidase
VLDLRGGEAEKVTSAATGVIAFDWLDAHTIVYAAREDSTLRERRLARDKDDVVVVADQEHYPPVRLFRVDFAAKRTARITTNDGVIEEFALSPDRRRVVTRENQDIDFRYDHRTPPRHFLTDLATGARREIVPAPHVDIFDFKWDAAGEGFYCQRDIASDSARTFVAISQLYYYDVETDSLHAVTAAWPQGLGGDYFPVAGGVVAALAGGVRDRIAFVTFAPDRKPSLRALHNDKSVRLAAAQPDGGRLVFFESTASTIPELMSARMRDGAFADKRRVIDLNEKLKERRLSRSEVVRWAGARGDTVEGFLYYPPDHQEGAPAPCVALIHGGPSGVDEDFFTERTTNYPHVLAARGTFVFKVNYHGSGGYGLEWLESIKGHYYEYEVPDILTGFDHLIARGLVDAEKLGIMGWSNGAILAIACCIESDRFKVLCAGAGDVNWSSDYGNCAFGAAFDEDYFGGPPWEQTSAYVEKSPIFRIDELRTPTLVLHGDRDTSVPTEQGWQLFRALQQAGTAPVRFLLFPGAGHGLVKPAHQRRKIEEELAWFDRYLFGAPDTAGAPLDERSPLALALEKSRVARVGSVYGVELEASIVPEMVTAAGVEVTRFEITNAQFAAFDPHFSYAGGGDNHPVTGISLPLAQAYCLWLDQKMGGKHRLPTTAEMEALLEMAEPNRGRENTLERWLGYTPTPDEVEMLQPALEEFERGRDLTEPVGSFAATGSVYDLMGNAAEWATGPKGEGRVVGLCARSLADRRAGAERAPLSYVGFRVVREGIAARGR